MRIGTVPDLIYLIYLTAAVVKLAFSMARWTHITLCRYRSAIMSVSSGGPSATKNTSHSKAKQSPQAKQSHGQNERNTDRSTATNTPLPLVVVFPVSIFPSNLTIVRVGASCLRLEASSLAADDFPTVQPAFDKVLA